MKGGANAAQNWLAAMQSPQTAANYKAGINAVTVNPMALAAQAAPLYLQNVTQAVNDGRYAQALNNASPAVWKANATGPGAQNLTTGAQKGYPKFQAFVAKFQPVWASIHQQVSTMPKGGLANALARVSATITALKQAAGKPTT
jgi:hypothetical protein